MGYLVGAYPAYPPHDPAGQAELLAGLATSPLVAGLELPFTGEPARLEYADPGWTYAVTAIPGTVVRNHADPDFGLAAPDPAGRRRALEFTRALRDHVASLVEQTRPGAVVAVEIHSAPSLRADATAFTDSLAEIATWDWCGSVVTVEHCDAADGVGRPQKGYLPIADEINAVRIIREDAPRTDVGVTINWARSAIERHDAGAPPEHIAQARQAGVLAGLMFSGCADHETAFGAAWLDAHLPPGEGLLTPPRIQASWDVADGVLFAGLKMGIRPATVPVTERLRRLDVALHLLEQHRT